SCKPGVPRLEEPDRSLNVCLVSSSTASRQRAPRGHSERAVRCRHATGRRGMKAVILAGGLGSRLSEETQLRPKPMVEIGGQPILWHIMKSYTAHGINDFVICCGYRGYVIKEWFANYSLHLSDVTFDLKNNVTE